MTPQEAMNWCEQFTDNLVMVDVDTKRRTLGLQAMQVCKSALEKQIPKKPRETRCALMCANCGHKITEKGCKKLNRLYCKKCGQAIDWSDTK